MEEKTKMHQKEKSSKGHHICSICKEYIRPERGETVKKYEMKMWRDRHGKQHIYYSKAHKTCLEGHKPRTLIYTRANHTIQILERKEFVLVKEQRATSIFLGINLSEHTIKKIVQDILRLDALATLEMF